MTAHLASIINPDRKVFAFGVTPSGYVQLEDKMENMGARSILCFVHLGLLNGTNWVSISSEPMIFMHRMYIVHYSGIKLGTGPKPKPNPNPK